MDLLSLLKSMEPMKKRQPAPSLADEPKKRKESTPQTHPKNSVSNAPQSKRQKTQDDTTAGNAPQSTDATKIIEQRKAFEAQQRLVAERLATRRQARESLLHPITTEELCVLACEHIRELADKYIAIDAEWCGSGRESKLCLLQVATSEREGNQVYLFDFVEGGTEMFNWGLREILEGTEIMKILHDCRWDSDILWTKHNVKLNNVFDTQVAFCVYTRQTQTYTPLPVGLNTVLTKFANTSNKHKEKAHKEMEDNPNYWLVRPMTAVMVDYAREDVIHLPYVYRQFKVMLDPRNIKLVMENSKKYVDQYRLRNEAPPSGKIDGIPKYGIEIWDKDAKQQLDRTKSRREYIGSTAGRRDEQGRMIKFDR